MDVETSRFANALCQINPLWHVITIFVLKCMINLCPLWWPLMM